MSALKTFLRWLDKAFEIGDAVVGFVYWWVAGLLVLALGIAASIYVWPLFEMTVYAGVILYVVIGIPATLIFVLYATMTGRKPK
jgi:hypothetical protein